MTLSATILPPPSLPKQATVAILPKPGISPANCERLGRTLTDALPQLHARESQQGNISAIADLLSGEQPKSPVMVAMALMRSSKRSVPIAASDAAAEAKKMFAGDPLMDICDRPAVIITIARNEYESDADLCARVAGALPAELASEVRLLSRSEDQQ